MYKFVLVTFAAFVAVSLAIDCSSLAEGFYCNANGGYTWCAGSVGYPLPCGSGTSCNCGVDAFCETPCTASCPTTSSTAAQAFCTDRLNYFSGEQGFFCDPESTGFYHCVRDSACPNIASIQSSSKSCASGTECNCQSNNYQECSNGLSQTPCSWPSEATPVTECTGHKWGCYSFNNEAVVFCGESLTCDADPFDDLRACFWDADTNEGVCAEDFGCSDSQPCSSGSDCPSGNVCVINSCCGAGGHCAPKCGN